jgi:hypothetical protein
VPDRTILLFCQQVLVPQALAASIASKPAAVFSFAALLAGTLWTS